MGKIRIHDIDESEWKTGAELSPPEMLDKLSETDKTARHRFHEKGSPTEIQLLESEFDANAVIPPHFHDSDEIIYIVAGEMHLGKRVLKPGASLMIQRDTTYTFKAGPQGLRMVNFRPCADFTYHLADLL